MGVTNSVVGWCDRKKEYRKGVGGSERSKLLGWEFIGHLSHFYVKFFGEPQEIDTIVLDSPVCVCVCRRKWKMWKRDEEVKGENRG